MSPNCPPPALLVIVAGKGGVGKTTVTAVLARAAADAGRRVLVIELDGKPTLRRCCPISRCGRMSAADSLEEYLHDHGFKRIAKRLVSTGVIDVIGTAAPGIDDLVVLGKIKQLERSGRWDLIVVDGPAAGHAITFLTTATGLLDAVRGGPVREQAQDVLDMLADPERCQVVLVTLPETTPVNEVIETAASLEARVGVMLGPIVVNRVDAFGEMPDFDAANAADNDEFDDAGRGCRVPDVASSDREVPDRAARRCAAARSDRGARLPGRRVVGGRRPATGGRARGVRNEATP